MGFPGVAFVAIKDLTNGLLIPSLFLAVLILGKLRQLFQFKKWTKDRAELIFQSLC